MALQKEITLPSGHICSYWRIVGITKDFIRDSGTVHVVGYRDAEARDSGMPPLSDSEQSHHGFIGHGGTDEAYEWLKGLKVLVPGQMVTNPDYDPESTGDIENAPFVWVPEHMVPGPFADAEDC